MSAIGFPDEVVGKIRDGIDCNVYFFGHQVGLLAMYGVLCGTIVLLVGLYILLNVLKGRKR